MCYLPKGKKMGAPRIERGTFRIHVNFSLLLSQLSYAPVTPSVGFKHLVQLAAISNKQTS